MTTTRAQRRERFVTDDYSNEVSVPRIIAIVDDYGDELATTAFSSAGREP